MVDYIADYLETVRERRVFPDVRPGYMRDLLPASAPDDPEHWDNIFADVERVIMPGVTHWQSPYMHAYFPALNSYPSLLGDMLADGINCLGCDLDTLPDAAAFETDKAPEARIRISSSPNRLPSTEPSTSTDLP